MGDFTFGMFASWRLERLERDFNLDCLVFGLMPCNFHKRRHRNDAKVKHSASLINKCLWTWEPSKKGSKNQTGYFKMDIIRYWCTVHTYTNYIYMCIHVYIIDYLCVCKSLSLSVCQVSVRELRPSPSFELAAKNRCQVTMKSAWLAKVQIGISLGMDPIESKTNIPTKVQWCLYVFMDSYGFIWV